MKIFNKIICVFLFMFIFLLSINKVSAIDITATVNDADGVYVRSDASTKNTPVDLLKYGTTITLVNSNKITSADTSCTEWYQIYYNGASDRYVCSSLVILDSSATVNSTGYYTTANWGFRINENYATVRKTANGTTIENIYLGTSVKKNSCSGGWCYITYYGSKKGYVKESLISGYSDITANVDETDPFIIEMKQKGFPNSYLPFLAYLHNKYPNWKFNAVTMKKTFKQVVSNEQGKNKLKSPPDIYKLSKNVSENPNWYTTTSAVDSVYLDPRTYLSEKNIFAFEDLKYDSTFPNLTVIQQLFKGTYLENVDPDSIKGIDPTNTEEIEKKSKTYIDHFMAAGIKHGVSPAHLAARAKQEGMTNATYAAISGTATSVNGLKYKNQSLDGYYNYFNINAYQDNYTSSSVARGVAYAARLTNGADNSYGKPWDTREKAIFGGAQFLGENYVSVGQYTTYFQKFDISPTSNTSYINQYMTNLIAPASESLYTYSSRISTNIINTEFVFSIPVYSDLPEAFTTHPPIGDTDNTLSDLKIDGTTVLEFDNDLLSYSQFVASNKTSVVIEANANSSKATVTGTGTINLTSDEQDILINVTSEVGVLKTYKITIKKSPSSKTTETSIDAIIADVPVKLTTDNLSSTAITGIEENTTTSTLITLINSTAPTANMVIKNSSNVVKSGALATGDKLTITNGTNEKTYSIIIKGDNNGDGKITILDLLRIQKHILKASTLTNENYNACDTNYDNKIDILDLLRVQKHILGYIKLK